MGVKRTIVIGTLLVLASTSWTQTNSLTLADAKRVAFECNWDLLAAKSGIDAAEAQRIVSREFPNPVVSLSTARIGTHESTTVLGSGIWNRSYDSIAAVTQLIEIGGKRRARQTSALAGFASARDRFFDARRSLDQGVTKDYIAALLADNNVRILNESASYFLREVEIAAARFKAGDISDSDEKQIEINAEQFELQAKAAEATAIQARIAVEVLMGVNQPNGNWTSAESLEQLLNNSSPSAIVSASNAGRPDLLAAEAELRKSNADLKLQKALRIPDPTILLEAEHNPPGGGPAVDTIGLGLSFPLPLWNRNRGNIKAAEATRDQAAVELERTKAKVISDIASAEVAYKEALGRWQLYRDQTGPKSRKVRESVAFGYEKGSASLVDLLEAERTDNNIRQATVQAMSDAASAAADLMAARNVLSEAELHSQK
jgi:outer membrane protein, heavy metal efflux system